MSIAVGAIGTAVGLGSSIYGGIKAGQERKRMAKYLSGEKSDNEAWYNKNYYSDYTQRADTQNLMKNLRDNLKKNNEVASQTATITGATPEAQAVQKEQSNKVITDTTSNVAAMGAQHKERIQNQYMGRKAQLGSQEYGEMEGAAQGYENLMGNGIKAMGNSINGLASGLSTSGATGTPEEMAIDRLKINAAEEGRKLLNTK